MAEFIKISRREQLPLELTWDLSKIYATDQEFIAALKQVKIAAASLEALKGSMIKGPTDCLAAIQQFFKVERQFEKVYLYASLKNDQDTSNQIYQGFFSQVQQLQATVAAAGSWIVPELLQLSDQQLQDYQRVEPQLAAYQQFIKENTRLRPHVLAEREEKLLAQASAVFAAPEDIFETLNDTDLKFPLVTNEAGKKIQLSQGNYDRLIQSPQRQVRKTAFQALYQPYRQLRNTFAKTLGFQVRLQNFEAKTHHYSSALNAALTENQIPSTVYQQLIDQVQANLPLLQRYVALRKKVLRLDQVHMYDLYTPLVEQPAQDYSYQQGQKIVGQTLKIFGDEYTTAVKQAFKQRWIDVLENRGKRSGAYSSGMYDTPAYILLNWQNDLESVYTLIHEIGHSMHSYFSAHYQPYQTSDYSIFLAEIASTTNENLLTAHLLEQQDDTAIRAYLLNHFLDGFKGTVFRQTQFAEFEKWLHEQEAAGESLTADKISHYYLELNQKYYGEQVAADPEIALEWARIPHFYYNFYVYQYATGFAAATALSQQIITKGPQTYLNFLKAGSSAAPIDIIRRAGVDMEQPIYLQQAFDLFARRLGELEELLN
ncbi:MAG: oligoendopeptidase F [Liquorilactobacillus ghanensis]|uniref:oligoendopeptidase F n=1 Tax=Liquorilactobacillus ghanensis TaxID=399370 RepID=UPI0039EB0AAE